jgi:23S rRNA (guanine745-N1)-methyltransferase
MHGRTLVCDQKHSFDVARQDYANLLAAGAQSGTADDPTMVDARVRFQGSGNLSPIADTVAAAAEDSIPREGCIVDVGSGPGYYLSRLLDRLTDRIGLALDNSKYAARRAARSHPRAGAVVCDVWQPLPVLTDSAALALCVFAPRNGAELARVLRPDAALIMVTPNPNHSRELVETLELLTVDEDKGRRVEEKLKAHFNMPEQELVEYEMLLDHAMVEAWVAMGPSAYHVDVDALRMRIDELPHPMQVTASVTVAVYRPR